MTEINEYRQNLQPLILSEAERLFRQKGIKAVTMEEISKNLHISKRTIYELYTNKEEVLIEVLKNVIKQRTKHLEEFCKSCSNVMDILIDSFRIQLQTSLNTHPKFYHDIEKYPGAKAMLQKHHENERKASQDFLMQGIKQGYFLPNVNLDIFMRIVSVTKGAILNDPQLKKLTFNELLNNYIYIITRGFCTQKGLVKFDEFMNNYNKA